MMLNVERFAENRDANELIVEVFRLNGQLIATADRLVSKFGITGARWQVMGALVRSGGRETVPRLAKDMGLTRQSVQRVVNEMVIDGMLLFEDNPHHKRSQLVTLSAKGEKVFTAALEIQLPWVKALSKGIGKKRMVDAKLVLEALRKRLEKEGANKALRQQR
jgi:DNA-binding MarR family transcriptional regulator